jgi:hypothetical protein
MVDKNLLEESFLKNFTNLPTLRENNYLEGNLVYFLELFSLSYSEEILITCIYGEYASFSS